MSQVCILLADGYEEIEAITVIDILRRAQVDVMVLGVTGLDVTGAHKIHIHADRLLRDKITHPWEGIVLPGGTLGAQTLRDSSDVQAFLRDQAQRPDVFFAAICAGPIALAQAELLQGRQATCYPGFEHQLQGALIRSEAVVVDDRIITSRGPGTAIAFALTLVTRLVSRTTAQDIQKSLLVEDLKI